MGPQPHEDTLRESMAKMPHVPGGAQAAMLLQHAHQGWPPQEQDCHGRPALQLLPLKRPRQSSSCSENINFGTWQQHMAELRSTSTGGLPTLPSRHSPAIFYALPQPTPHIPEQHSVFLHTPRHPHQEHAQLYYPAHPSPTMYPYEGLPLSLSSPTYPSRASAHTSLPLTAPHHFSRGSSPSPLPLTRAYLTAHQLHMPSGPPVHLLLSNAPPHPSSGYPPLLSHPHPTPAAAAAGSPIPGPASHPQKRPHLHLPILMSHTPPAYPINLDDHPSYSLHLTRHALSPRHPSRRTHARAPLGHPPHAVHAPIPSSQCPHLTHQPSTPRRPSRLTNSSGARASPHLLLRPHGPPRQCLDLTDPPSHPPLTCFPHPERTLSPPLPGGHPQPPVVAPTSAPSAHRAEARAFGRPGSSPFLDPPSSHPTLLQRPPVFQRSHGPPPSEAPMSPPPTALLHAPASVHLPAHAYMPPSPRSLPPTIFTPASSLAPRSEPTSTARCLRPPPLDSPTSSCHSHATSRTSTPPLVHMPPSLFHPLSTSHTSLPCHIPRAHLAAASPPLPGHLPPPGQPSEHLPTTSKPPPDSAACEPVLASEASGTPTTGSSHPHQTPTIPQGRPPTPRCTLPNCTQPGACTVQSGLTFCPSHLRSYLALTAVAHPPLHPAATAAAASSPPTYSPRCSERTRRPRAVRGAAYPQQQQQQQQQHQGHEVWQQQQQERPELQQASQLQGKVPLLGQPRRAQGEAVEASAALRTMLMASPGQPQVVVLTV